MLGMNPFTLLELLGQPEFQSGIAIGVAGLVLLLILRRVGWLLVWGVAAFGALAWVGRLGGTEAAPEWGLVAVAVTAIAAAAAFYVLLRQLPAWSIGIAFALWVLGVWGTVPDTERAAVTMGVTAAMLPALWPALRVRIGWEGGVVAVAALGFVAITDGSARPISIIGALGMAGMPITAAAALHWLRPSRQPSAWWFVGAQAAHVIVSGRVAGQLLQLEGALVVVILSALLMGGWLAWGIRPS